MRPPRFPHREALRVGLPLGWLSVLAVLVALALGAPVEHVELLVALTLVAALAHAVVTTLPWPRWLERLRAHDAALLDAWTGGLIAFVTALVLIAGAEADLDLLLFGVGPFIATVHAGRRRIAWLALMGAAYATAMAVAPDPLALADVALRAVLLCAAVVLALALAQATAREAAARVALEDELAEARDALAERKLVERAKGILGDALGLSEAEAFRRLQRSARDRNLRLADVARRVIEQEALLRR